MIPLSLETILVIIIIIIRQNLYSAKLKKKTSKRFTDLKKLEKLQKHYENQAHKLNTLHYTTGIS